VPVPAPAAVRPSVRQPLRAPEPPARPALPVSPGPQRAPRGGEGQWRGGQSLCKFAPGDPWVSPPLPPAWAPFVPRVPQLREPPREAGGGGLYSNRGGGGRAAPGTGPEDCSVNSPAPAVRLLFVLPPRVVLEARMGSAGAPRG
jgi:hypothetical protein